MMLSDDVWRLSVCPSVAYIGPKSRTERPRKTRICTEVAHVTRDSDTTFKVKRSKVKVTMPLLTAALTRQAAAAVSMGTYWAWELLLRCGVLGGARRFGAYRGWRGAGAYRGGRPPTDCINKTPQNGWRWVDVTIKAYCWGGLEKQLMGFNPKLRT